MDKATKIEAIVQSRLSRMDLADLEAFYVDIKTEELEDLSEDMLDQILDEEVDDV